MTAGPVCSVVVAARNEKGTIETLVRSIPCMGSHTEIVFVEGCSEDSTRQEIQRVIADFQDRDVKLVCQDTGSGKADALRRGFAAARGDILIVCDADMTVPPRELPSFFNALTEGNGRFANGSRLARPMETGAMPFLNFLANHLFGKILSFLLGQPVSDCLCGTKALWRDDYLRMSKDRDVFAGDPFGDFGLLFGAGRLGLKIIEIPVTYKTRVYGRSNIRRWRDGLLLLRLCWTAFGELRPAVFRGSRSAP